MKHYCEGNTKGKQIFAFCPGIFESCQASAKILNTLWKKAKSRPNLSILQGVHARPYLNCFVLCGTTSWNRMTAQIWKEDEKQTFSAVLLFDLSYC